MRCAHDRSTTRVVSCKSNLQLACDRRVRHEECRGLLKHVLKPYDNRSDRQFYIVEIVYDFSMTRAASATKIACDNRKQKSYRVNRPLTVPVSGTSSVPNNWQYVHSLTFGKLVWNEPLYTGCKLQQDALKFHMQDLSETQRTMQLGQTLLFSHLITYRAKLLNADWFRQRAFFLNFPSMEGKIT